MRYFRFSLIVQGEHFIVSLFECPKRAIFYVKSLFTCSYLLLEIVPSRLTLRARTASDLAFLNRNTHAKVKHCLVEYAPAHCVKAGLRDKVEPAFVKASHSAYSHDLAAHVPASARRDGELAKRIIAHALTLRSSREPA